MGKHKEMLIDRGKKISQKNYPELELKDKDPIQWEILFTQIQGIVENAREMGLLLKQGLQDLQAKHLSVGDVRCIGLFSTIELVKDRETREPLAPLPGLPSSPQDSQVAPRLSAALRERGMHCFVKWNYLFPIPPLCIQESQLREGLAILDDVLNIADRLVAGQ